MKSSVPYAVAAILAATAVRALAATPATDPPPAPNDGPATNVAPPASATAATNAAAAGDGNELSTIIVTAQRRTENIQDVPISMQALTSQTMQQLNIKTFDDYVKYLPNVTAANNGPGQNEIFMRGVSAGSQASQGSGSTGLWPNVAVYLDDQSVQLPNRNLDVYAADLQRIEVLEGPQGTLFGAGAQAGVIRYITNKPQLDRTSGSVAAGYGTTAHGDNNSDVTAVLNLPVMAGHMALRAVIYDARRGGYIDNVPATFARKDTDVGIHYAGYAAVNGQCPDGQPNNGYCVPPGSPTVSNAQLAGRAINPVEYQGARVEALYKFNDDWDLLLTQSYQDLNSQGVFYQQPYASDGTSLSPLEVTLFNKAYDKDKFENTAWTVHGKVSSLDFVYTGGYLDRNVEQVGDYTNYARGVYADYYQCYGPYSASNALTPTCFSPSAAWRSVERNVHQQHEVRLSTPDSWRLRAIAGLYYEDNALYDQTGWHYKSVPPCTSNGAPGTSGNTGCESDVGTFPGTTVQNRGLQNDTTSFYQDQLRTTRQIAEYFSTSYDLVPQILTLTGGLRHFRFLNSEAGSVLATFGCFQAGTPPGGCQSGSSTNLNAKDLSDTEDGNKVRANVTWHIRPDMMVYYTFSQGFRPGGFNQNGGAMHGNNAAGVPQYIVPRSYTSDNLTNNEIGWKTEFLDHRLQWNGAVYYDNWTNVQVEFFNPGVVGNIFYDTNGQDFLIKGIETSFVARLMTGLTLQGAADWNKSSQTNSPALIDNNPADAGNVGKPITQVCPAGVCSAVSNPFGPIGAPSANAPPMQFSLRARYDWLINDYVPYVQIGVRHTAHSFSQAGANPEIGAGGSITTSRGRFENPAYSTLDAAIGVSKGDWHVDLHGDNLANSNASTFTSTDQFIIEQTPLRPRVIELSFGYHFE
ncbi:MAG TPA: TonB-dependent receptor [Steroidobacteraceae bacterium]|jgi:outer membrane receptor protein involved in Fe transport